MSSKEEEQPYIFSNSDIADAWLEVSYDYRKHILTQFKKNDGTIKVHLDPNKEFCTFCDQALVILKNIRSNLKACFRILEAI